MTVAWRGVVDDVGNLPKRATPPQVKAARKTPQSVFETVRVDREGKGYADLSIGAPAVW